MPNIIWLIIIVVIFLGVTLWLTNTNRPYFQPSDPIYLQIREFLRQTLLPHGFTESETIEVGNIAKYLRGDLLVELYFDWREGEYSFFASSDVKDPINPPRQVSITFLQADYTEQKMDAIRAALNEWLTTHQ